MMKIRRISKVRAFLSYSWIFLLPICFLIIVATIAKIYFLIPVMIILFLIVAFINFTLKGLTNTINITENKLTIERSQVSEFNFDNLTMQPIVIRSWFKGLLFKEGKREVIIWKHEFEKADWKKIQTDIGNQIQNS